VENLAGVSTSVWCPLLEGGGAVAIGAKAVVLWDDLLVECLASAARSEVIQKPNRHGKLWMGDCHKDWFRSVPVDHLGCVANCGRCAFGLVVLGVATKHRPLTFGWPPCSVSTVRQLNQDLSRDMIVFQCFP